MPIPEGAGPIPKVLTRERALETVRDWIVSGTLAPGEEIRDGELAEALGVSRSPVRVALVELQREGLVERAANGRVSVVSLSAMRAHDRRYESADFTGVPDLARLSAVDHDAVVAAIRSGDPDAAANAMGRHIGRD